MRKNVLPSDNDPFNKPKGYTLRYKEPIFGQEVVIHKVPGREPNTEAHEAIARLPVYVRLLDRLAKLGEKWASEDNGKLPF